MAGSLAAADGTIEKMVEYKDASPEERAIDLCNSGLMAARATDLFPLLGRVGNDNVAGEYYLPDVVMLAAKDGRKSAVIEAEPWEMAGVNSRAELALVEAEWQRRRRLKAMADGVTLVAPDTVWFAHDTEIGRDSVIEPNVVFGPGVSIGERVTIKAFSHLEGASDRRRRADRALCAAAPRQRDRRGRADRQFRRGQASDARPRRQGQPPLLSGRCRDRRQRQYRRRHDHLQL